MCDVLTPAPADRARCWRVSGGIVDAHHVVSKQLLKREFPRGIVLPPAPPMMTFVAEAEIPRADLLEPVRPQSLDDLLMDPRNGILVRRYHHDALEHRRVVIPADRLPESVIEFAGELGLGWYLDKMDKRRG